MNKHRQHTELPEEPPKPTRTYLWCAVAACALGLILYVLNVALPSLFQVYGIIAGILCELGALAFAKTQKKRFPVKYGKIVTVAAYVLLIAGVAFMIGGIIWAGTQ